MRRVFVLVGLFLGSLVLGPALGTEAQQAASTPGGRGTASPIPATSPPAAPVLAEFVREITLGTESGSSASGVAVDADGTIYVIDALKDHIRIFDRDGNPVTTWGESGTAPGQFRFSDVAIDAAGVISVTDFDWGRIVRFDPEGTVIATINSWGTQLRQFVRPWGVTVDTAGNLYVAEWTGSRVQVVAPDGAWLGSIGTTGYKPGQFISPIYLTISPEGLLYVANDMTGRVLVFRLLPPLAQGAGTPAPE